MATYLNMDPTLVRVLTVVLTLFAGVPVVVYLVLLLVVPEEGSDSWPNVPPGYSGGTSQTIPTTKPPAGDPVWGPTGAPWEQPAPTSITHLLSLQPGPITRPHLTDRAA